MGAVIILGAEKGAFWGVASIMTEAANRRLQDACVRGSLREASAAVEDDGADVAWADRLCGETAMHAVCHSGHLELARWLYHHVPACRGTLTRMDRGGCTPLHAASWGGHTQLVQWLCESVPEARCTVTYEDHHGKTPFMAACRANHKEVALRLAREPQVRPEVLRVKQSLRQARHRDGVFKDLRDALVPVAEAVEQECRTVELTLLVRLAGFRSDSRRPSVGSDSRTSDEIFGELEERDVRAQRRALVLTHAPLPVRQEVAAMLWPW